MKKKHSFDAVYDGQKMFRLILNAISNPLQKVNISEYSEKLYGNSKDFLAIAFTLLDNETTFCTFDNQLLDESITSLTLSEKETDANADFIFVEGERNLHTAIQHAKCGTLADPHKAATILVKIKASEDTDLTMYGAGIDGKRSIKTDGLVKKSIQMRDEMFFEYPQGLDFIFVDENGDLFAIPRLVKKEKS